VLALSSDEEADFLLSFTTTDQPPSGLHSLSPPTDGIIMSNKQLLSLAGYIFSFATTLTGFPFAVTALVGFVSNATRYTSRILKQSMIPVACMMEWILHNKHYLREVKMALVVVVLGVSTCTVIDQMLMSQGTCSIWSLIYLRQ
jgi:hypothetical protein